MKKAIVIGSGAAGATAAKELQGKFEVTVLEAGKPFRPFSYPLSMLESLRKTGLFFNEREISMLFPTMQIRKTSEKMVLVNGIGTGGTTTISAGNALRMDQDLKKIGVDLSDEFDEIFKEIPISTEHQKHWKKTTKQLFKICGDMNLNPQVTPKMGHYERCTHCGKCILGCPYHVKWDSRQFLNNAIVNGANLITGCRVKKIKFEKGQAKGVIAVKGISSTFIPADIIVLCAGGMGTPVILENSGIHCTSELFVDPVLCVAAEWPNALQNKEVSMPFVVQQEHYMISPYFDYLSFFFNKSWRKPARNIMSLMIKLADSKHGKMSGNKVDKVLTVEDRTNLQQAVDQCTDIFKELGINKQDLFMGTLNAGHPGGMLPLTKEDANQFHPSVLPENLFVADATLLPESLGNPPILTIIAIAKRISKLITRGSI